MSSPPIKNYGLKKLIDVIGTVKLVDVGSHSELSPNLPDQEWVATITGYYRGTTMARTGHHVLNNLHAFGVTIKNTKGKRYHHMTNEHELKLVIAHLHKIGAYAQLPTDVQEGINVDFNSSDLAYSRILYYLETKTPLPLKEWIEKEGFTAIQVQLEDCMDFFGELPNGKLTPRAYADLKTTYITLIKMKVAQGIEAQRPKTR